MNALLRNKKQGEQGSILAYFIVVMIIVSGTASLATYVSHTVRMAHRRNDMISARQFAEGGAVIVCKNLAVASTNKANTFLVNLAANYTKNTSLSTSQSNVYERTISTPFTNQTVFAQIWMPIGASPSLARVVTTAGVGQVSQRAVVVLQMAWPYPAAIISTSYGTSAGGANKSIAQQGNVVVTGGSSGKAVVDGGILANGKVNTNAYASVPSSAISMTNRFTANEIPDYTAQGTANALFDFSRFIAAANATTNSLNTATRNNHFTNVALFVAANNIASTNASKALEGIIVVDVPTTSDPGISTLNPSGLPRGINVRGSLLFNFGPSFLPLDKIVNTADININPANLGGLVATNPATFTTGYPPVYYDKTKNPTNANIVPKGFINFTSNEDLPALMYSTGVLDIHGACNISGVCYTPSFMEIENKQAGQIQYFKGSLIMGSGIIFDNQTVSTSIVSYDSNAINYLATSGNSGKKFAVSYWE